MPTTYMHGFIQSSQLHRDIYWHLHFHPGGHWRLKRLSNLPKFTQPVDFGFRIRKQACLWLFYQAASRGEGVILMAPCAFQHLGAQCQGPRWRWWGSELKYRREMGFVWWGEKDLRATYEVGIGLVILTLCSSFIDSFQWSLNFMICQRPQMGR